MRAPLRTDIGVTALVCLSSLGRLDKPREDLEHELIGHSPTRTTMVRLLEGDGMLDSQATLLLKLAPSLCVVSHTAYGIHRFTFLHRLTRR